jgi:hypothetical protein
MKTITLVGIMALLLAAAACESPVEPSSVDERNPINITNVINIGGDTDDHSNTGGGDDTKGDDGGGDPVNSAPFITPVPTQENEVGDSVSLSLTASDADAGDTITWQWLANSAPRNLTLQSTGPRSALISGVISSSSATDSPFTTTIFASDGQAEASSVFLWIVTAPEPVP